MWGDIPTTRWCIHHGQGRDLLSDKMCVWIINLKGWKRCFGLKKSHSLRAKASSSKSFLVKLQRPGGLEALWNLRRMGRRKMQTLSEMSNVKRMN
jgi:hypothetical protein